MDAGQVKTKDELIQEMLWIMHRVLQEMGPMPEKLRLRIVQWRGEVMDLYPDMEEIGPEV